jgi:hypothetical protein
MNKHALREQRLRAYTVLQRLGHTEFKPETSAKWVDISRSWDGCIRVQIEHEEIKGCTPAMMRWWFENLAATTSWNGVDFSGPEVSHYHLWHHRDHIAVVPLRDGPANGSNGFAQGATTVIREQFNDYRDLINATVTTTRLDDTEFTFVIKRFGLTVGRIVHLYHETDTGLRFYAETEIGVKTPVLGLLFNWLVRPFVYSKATASHWIKHNIEETGQSEIVVPPLYAAHQA